MKVILSSEHAGYELKEKLVAYLRQKGVDCHTDGAESDTPINYPPIARRLCERVASGEFDLGILICGTGIGMSLAANKVPGIRAALCTDPFMARMARQHNNANVLCLGAWITGLKLNYEIVDTYLQSAFAGGRHEQRVAQIMEIEQAHQLVG